MTNLENSSNQSSQLNKIFYILPVIALLGFIDAVYLTTKYYSGNINCSIISGCQEVLSSQYSAIVGIPLALLGALYYLFVLIAAIVYIDSRNKWALKIISIFPTIGFLFSIWLTYLQAYVIKAFCQYCILSALTSTILFILSLIIMKKNKLPKEKLLD
jgi:uncharacterized membrane protein